MTIRPSGRHVVPNVPAVPVCIVPVRSHALQTVRISTMSCCVHKIDLCIAQGADKTFRFKDQSTDLTGVTAITFDVWRNSISGDAIFSASLEGGEITVPDPEFFQFEISSTTSQALPIGRHYCEAWITLADGTSRLLVGAGTFEVKDTRKHD